MENSFQAYTSGTVLLHSVVQKQLHNFNPSTWQEDIDNVKDCLSALEFCGSLDRVAAQFHERLGAIFQEVLAYSIPNGVSMDTDDHQTTSPSRGTFTPMEGDGEARQQQPQPVDHAYLLDIPAQADRSHTRLSFLLLMILSQPFGDPDTKEAAELNLKKHWLTHPSRYEYPQMADRVDWNLESRHMFQWDLSKINIPSLDTMVSEQPSSEDVTNFGLSDSMSPVSFLGSTEPSGWTSAASLTKAGRN